MRVRDIQRTEKDERRLDKFARQEERAVEARAAAATAPPAAAAADAAAAEATAAHAATAEAAATQATANALGMDRDARIGYPPWVLR